jgi:hypothetical protein
MLTLARPLRCAGDEGDLARVGELHRVAEQVEQDLSQPVAVAHHRLRDARRHRTADPEAFLSGPLGDKLHGGAQAGVQVKRGEVELKLAGFDPREVEEVGDHGQQGCGAGLDGVDQRALLVAEPGVP